MRGCLLLAGLLGASGVALGAYAAHGLESALAGMGYDEMAIADRVASFEIGVRYQLHAALATLGLAALWGRGLCGRGALVATIAFVTGVALFCGCLYGLALLGEGWRWLGAVVPLGGLSMIAGWAVIAVEAFRIVSPTADVPQDSFRNADRVRLEEVVSHQQQLLQDLNESLTATRDASDESDRRIKALHREVERLSATQEAAGPPADERPPHY